MISASYISFKKIIVVLRLICLILLLAPIAWAEGNIEWEELKTKHTILRYQNTQDLRDFDKKIKYSVDYEFSLFTRAREPGNSNERLGMKVDSIYERAQEILDMRKSMKRVKINIYSSKDQLHDAYFRIFRKRGKLRAWYIFEHNTIYLTIEDVFAGMLAHEMAHSIIDHYLTVRPPPASAEILARYVDSHLMP